MDTSYDSKGLLCPPQAALFWFKILNWKTPDLPTDQSIITPSPPIKLFC